MTVTAIFDIGKTNKKFLLFDQQHQEVYKEYIRLDERLDEDGFPCDDIEALQAWMVATLKKAMRDPRFEITDLNFSAYGASFVHLNKAGEVIAPIFNYLKPYPQDILDEFHQKYGDSQTFAKETASPPLGMLNSGLQLYWLKYAKPELFKQIRWSLHLPQYLSYLFTGTPVSDYTSIGCHTGLWNMEKNDYHEWVYAEEIDRILPPIVKTGASVRKIFAGKELNIGAGIHDSSAALLPYAILKEAPFMVLSTGTWSICLNPFNQEALSERDLQKDCLQFLSVEGKKVKASRLFLGNEYKIWTHHLANHFHQPHEIHRDTKLDLSILHQLRQFPAFTFKWEQIPSDHTRLAETDLSQFDSYEMAYHKLMQELADLQIQSILLAKGTSEIKQMYIDGGFIDNEIFLHFLSQGFFDIQLIKTDKPLGSAIGAAMVMENHEKIATNNTDRQHPSSQ